MDIYAIILAFMSKRGADGQYWHKPPCRYCPHNPNLDINYDGVIDMQDIYTAILNFNKKW